MVLDYKNSNNRRDSKEFFNNQDSDRNTSWYLAAKNGYITVTDVLYELAQSENEPTVPFPCHSKQHNNYVTACCR
jgi:hypothetical protein